MVLWALMGHSPSRISARFWPLGAHCEDGHGGWSVSPPHPLYVPLRGYPDGDVRPPAPALATHTASYEVGYGEIITVSLPYGQQIHRGAMQASGVLAVDMHTMPLADLLPDGSYMGRQLGRAGHG
jgi:hypothetical protein